MVAIRKKHKQNTKILTGLDKMTISVGSSTIGSIQAGQGGHLGAHGEDDILCLNHLVTARSQRDRDSVGAGQLVEITLSMNKWTFKY